VDVVRAVIGNSAWTLRALLLAASATAVVAAGQDQTPNRREVTLTAREHTFIPSRIEVVQDDLVRISLTSEDRPYSFAIDAYRILKRAGTGQTVVFEFRADQPGTFTFYCNLTSDPQCRDMKGSLIVTPK
jgi:heme/copper-type cytochrome/quinol oxidase subunit 2